MLVVLFDPDGAGRCLVKGWRTRHLAYYPDINATKSWTPKQGQHQVRSKASSTGCWECGENQEISEPSMKKRVRLAEWESPMKARGAFEGCWACALKYQSDLFKVPGLSTCFGDAWSFLGWWTTSPVPFGSVAWYACLMQELKAECELGNPEASRNHGSLPGRAVLIEWAVFAAGERAGSGGRIAQRQDHKSCCRGKKGDESPLKKCNTI